MESSPCPLSLPSVLEPSRQARPCAHCWQDWQYSIKQQPGSYSPGTQSTHSQAGVVPSAKVKTALLVHGVVDSGQFRGLGPGALKRVIKEAVIGTVVGTGEASQPES